MIALALALILPWSAMFMLLRLCHPVRSWPTTLLHLCTALGLALAISSATAFAWVATGGVIDSSAFRLFDAAPWLVIILILAWHKYKSPRNLLKTAMPVTPEKIPLWLKTAFAVVLTFSLSAMIFNTLRLPYGGYDSFTIWNLYARFYYCGGETWTRFLEIQYFSPNHYPQLIPLTLARIYSCQGSESLKYPLAMQLLLALATSGVLLGGLTILRGPLHGSIAAMLLLATKPFIAMPAQHMADGPVSFFMLASLTCLLMALKDKKSDYYWLILCGLLAGAAAWTKNEGQLFLLVIMLLGTIAFLIRDGLKPLTRAWVMLTAGILPLLLIAIWFKTGYAPPGYMFSQPEGAILEKLCDFSRYLTVIKTMLHEGLRFGEGIMPLLLVSLLLLWRKEKHSDCCGRVAAGCALLMACGYGMVYVISPFELHYQMRTALERHILQLWPLIILGTMAHMTFAPAIDKTAGTKDDLSKADRKSEID